MNLVKYFLFVLVFAGCAQLSGNSSSQRQSNPSADTLSNADVAHANNQFAFNLYQQLNREEGNVFVSPYSISTAMGMTYTGASGETRKEISGVFGFHRDNKKHARGFASLQQHFSELDQEQIRLRIANGLWGQKDYDFKDAFLNLNREYFSARVENVDFRDQASRVRREINQWVEEQTQDKIQDLISEGVLDRMTRLVLVNAIYFYGNWEHPFSENSTSEGDFFIQPGRKIQVPFMHQTLRVPFYEDGSFKALALPYKNGDLSMLILLPNEHEQMKELEEQMDASFYQRLNDSLERDQVKISFPRFEMKNKYRLNNPLQQMGMESAFSGDADFSGMTGRKELYISDVIHQTYVKVNERGTEAAAATGVVMRKTSFMPRKEFKADHPFLFMIRDNQTQTILFLGKVNNPG